jgi:hypothetical protein
MAVGDENHPARRDLESFMHAELPPSEVSGVVRHLLAGCPVCLKVTRRLFRPEPQAFELEEVPGEGSRPVRLAVSLRGRLLKFNGR